MIQRILGVVEDYGGWVLLWVVAAVTVVALVAHLRGVDHPLAALRLASPVLVLCAVAVGVALWPRTPSPGAVESMWGFVFIWAVMIGLVILALALVVDGSRYAIRRRDSG